MTIRYVQDIEASKRFYENLGLAFDEAASFPVWAQFNADAGALGLHDVAASKGKAPGSAELALATDERLEAIATRLDAKGFPYEIFGEDFGRSLRVVDPDGVTVQIQEIDYALAKSNSK
ncbi:MAG: VOC family protein [Clostridiales Family XIII bacterium]|nr:VOC family protein [Clostridiales Family XIII bacterium]